MNWMIEAMKAQEATAKKFEKISINNVVVESFENNMFTVKITRELVDNFLADKDASDVLMSEGFPIWKFEKAIENNEALTIPSRLLAIFLGYWAKGENDMINEYSESLVKSVEVEEVENTIDEEEFKEIVKATVVYVSDKDVADYFIQAIRESEDYRKDYDFVDDYIENTIEILGYDGFIDSVISSKYGNVEQELGYDELFEEEAERFYKLNGYDNILIDDLSMKYRYIDIVVEALEEDEEE